MGRRGGAWARAACGVGALAAALGGARGLITKDQYLQAEATAFNHETVEVRARAAPTPPPGPSRRPCCSPMAPPHCVPPGVLRHLPLSDPGRALGPRRRLPAGGDPPGAPAPPRPRPPFTPRSPRPPGARASAGPRGSGSGRRCSNLPAPSGDRWVGLAGKSLGVVVAGGDLPGLREVLGGSADCPGGRAQGRAGLERGRRPARGGGLMLTGFGALRSSSWPRGRTRTTS